MIKNLRSIKGQVISARNRLTCCEGIAVGLGLPEDGVDRHLNTSERKLTLGSIKDSAMDVSWSVIGDNMVRVCL